MTGPTRSRLQRSRPAAADPKPRMAIPVHRDYAAGLDPDGIRILDLARLGLDVAIGGPAGTGKSALVKRFAAMASSHRQVSISRPDGTVTHLGTRGKPQVNVVDESGLAAFDPFADRDVQTVTTFDMLQTSFIARQPKWTAMPAERVAEHVITRHSYRRKSIGNAVSPQEDGGPRTLPGPRRKASQAGETFRVGSAYPDPMSTALGLAAMIMKNGLSNPNIAQTAAVARRETMDILREILTLRPLAYYRIPNFVHPMLIQGSENDLIVLEVAGVDAMRISDPHRWATVAFSRAGYRLDILMPKRSEPLPHASASDAIAAIVCLPAKADGAKVLEPVSKDLDGHFAFDGDAIAFKAYAHRGTTHVSRPSLRDAPFESPADDQIVLARTDLSKSPRESVILPVTEDLRSIAWPLTTAARLRRRANSKKAADAPSKEKKT